MRSALLTRHRHSRNAPPPRVEVTASARAPMRISLAGGGTDVPPLAKSIGGRVVATAIGLHVRATVSPFDRGWVRLEGTWGLADVATDARPPPSRSDAQPPRSTRSPGETAPPVCGAALTRRAGDPPSTDVAFRLLEAVRAAAGVTDGVHIFLESDLTPGTGLGGSATAAVALLAAFHRALGLTIPLERLATTASGLERDALGLRCGLQDQLCAAVGGVLDLHFSDDGFRVTELVAPTPQLLRDLAAGLLLIDTGVRRVSSDHLCTVDNAGRRDICADLVAAAEDTARGFRLGSLPIVLAGMRRSAGAKLRRGGPSALPLDLLRRLSALGAVIIRACGAGGGGHVLLWAQPACHPALLRAVEPGIIRRPPLAAPGVAIIDM